MATRQTKKASEAPASATLQPRAESGWSSYAVERVPGTMQTDGTARKTTTYVDYAFREDAGSLAVDASELPVVTVDDRNVVFA